MNNLAHVPLHDLVKMHMGLDALCQTTADDLLGPDAYDLFSAMRNRIGVEFLDRGVNRTETYKEIAALLPEYSEVRATVNKIQNFVDPPAEDDGHDVGYNTAADESELA